MTQNSSNIEEERLSACEGVLQYQFEDRALLRRSLTHASIAVTRLRSNERMEFLGDAILGAIICDQLFRLYPNDEEGQLTQMKSDVVSRTACAQATLAIGLEQFLFLSKGLLQSRELPTSVLAGLFESVIAAIYLDGGYAAAETFVKRNLEHLIHHSAETEHFRSAKSELQHLTQKSLGTTPTYRLLDEVGPDHSKHFLVSAVVGKSEYAPAWGTNKKEAEQKAALNAMHQMEGKEIPYPDHQEPTKASADGDSAGKEG